MEMGNETWKWGLVCALLAVFLLVANQAYQALTTQEEFSPPDDYLKGDSFDMEHRSGPGGGQAIDIPAELINNASDSVAPGTDRAASIAHPTDMNWDAVKDPSKGN